MGAFKDLTGQTFSRLTVISRAPNLRPGATRWNCVCTCGNTLIVEGSLLKNGKTQSCGCLHREAAAKTGAASATHGEGGKTRLYRIWSNMKTRCENKHNKNYARWGSRGVYVCDEWRSSYTAFRDWAKVNGYSDGYSLDRIDNNGAYSTENCRWVSAKAQARNTRKNKFIEYKGYKKCIAEWAEYFGVPYMTLYNRLKSLSVEEAFSKCKSDSINRSKK